MNSRTLLLVCALLLASLQPSLLAATELDREAETGCGCNPCPCSPTVTPETVDYRLEVGGDCHCAAPPPCTTSPCAPAPPCQCARAPSRCGATGCGTAFDGKVMPEYKDERESNRDIIIKPRRRRPPPPPPTPPPTAAPTPAPTAAPTPAPTPPPPTPSPTRKPRPKPSPTPTPKPKPLSSDLLKKLSKLMPLPKRKKTKKGPPRAVNATVAIQLKNAGYKKAVEEAAKEKEKEDKKRQKRKHEQEGKIMKAKIAAMKQLIEQQVKGGKAKKGALPLPPVVKPPLPRRGQITSPSSAKTFENGYGEPQWNRVGKGLCVLSGVSTMPRARLLTELPEYCRPAGRVAFSQHGMNLATQRTDVLPNGNTYMVTGSLETSWFSYDGIIFPRQFKNAPNPTMIAPQQPWINFGAPYSPLSFTLEGKVCVLSGMIKLTSDDMSTWRKEIGILPHECRPNLGRVTFVTNQHEQSHRIDILASGDIHWMAGKKAAKWLSLSGIAFSVATKSTKLALINSWSAFGNGFRVPAWNREKSLCILGGTLKSPADAEKQSKVLATLPFDCRPSGHLIFTTNSHYGLSRFDVFPDGNVMLIAVEPKKAAALVETGSTTKVASRSKAKAGWWWRRRRHRPQPRRIHIHWRPVIRHHHHHHHHHRRPPPRFVPARPRPVTHTVRFFHNRWQEQRRKQVAHAVKREQQHKREHAGKAGQSHRAEQDQKRRQQLEQRYKSDLMRRQRKEEQGRKTEQYVKNYQRQLMEGVAKGKWSKEQQRLQEAAFKAAQHKLREQRHKVEQIAKTANELARKNTQASNAAQRESARKASERMRMEFKSKHDESFRKRLHELRAKKEARMYAKAREAEKKAAERIRKQHAEQKAKLDKARQDEMLQKAHIANLIKGGKEAEAKAAQHALELRAKALAKLVKFVANLGKQVKADNNSLEQDRKLAEREHRRRAEQRVKAEKKRLKKLEQQAKRSKEEVKKSVKKFQEEVFKLRRGAREQCGKTKAKYQEEIAKSQAEKAKFEKMEADIKKNPQQVTKMTKEQEQKLLAPLMEEKNKLEKANAIEKKLQEKNAAAMRRQQLKNQLEVVKARKRAELEKLANQKALAEARKAKQKMAQELQAAMAAENKAKLAAVKTAAAEQLSKGKISAAQMAEQVSKAQSRSQEENAKLLKARLEREEQQQKADLKRKRAPKEPRAAPLQTASEVELAIRKTAPLPLPKLPPAWYSLDGIQFVVTK